ncbi:TPA: hypothetical protein ACWXH1_004448 [Escherichia coli]
MKPGSFFIQNNPFTLTPSARCAGFEVKKALSLDYRHWIISVRLPYSERPPRASRTFQQRIWR